MRGATLSVLRINEHELWFSLQMSRSSRPAILQNRKLLYPEQRQDISAMLEDFALCLEGFHADEPKFRDIGEALFLRVLPQAIREQLRILDEPLTILTDDPTLPWEVMHDGSEFLALKFPIARQLIIHESMASLVRPKQIVETGFSALIIADPTGDLPGARNEGEALYELFKERGTCEILVNGEATSAKILERLVHQPYSVIHFCGHVDYDRAGHLSSLRLRNGRRLRADDVLSIFKGTPVVFLNACYSDNPGLTSGGSRAEGFAWAESFAQAFMIGSELGVASAVIGAMWRIPDEPIEAGCEFALNFYQQLFDGKPVGEALRISRMLARERERGPMTWAPYVLYGDSSLSPFNGPVNNKTSGPADTTSSSVAPISDDEQSMETRSTTSSRSLGTELAAATPLDTVARRILHTALNEMTQMRQGGLTTMHLLIGLCTVGVDHLSRVLRKQNLESDQVCALARHRALQLVPSDERGSFVSTNVQRALVFAARRAYLFGRNSITPQDLLAGILKCEYSQAIKVLEAFTIDRENLLRRLPTLPRLDIGWFDRPMQEVIEYAINYALQAYQDYLGTPHLMIGLIKTNSRYTAALFQAFDVTLETFCDLLTTKMRRGDPANTNSSEQPALYLTSRCSLVIQRAYDLAQNRLGERIAEPHLLQAILEEHDGVTTRAMQQVGLQPELLLALLHKSASQTKLQFDGLTQEALAQALGVAGHDSMRSLSTPYLLIGLIRCSAILTMTLLVEHGVDLEQLCSDLRAAMYNGRETIEPEASSTPKLLTRRCRAVLQRANDLAQEMPDGHIAERHLLQAILEERNGITARVLTNQGAPPDSLLANLPQLLERLGSL